jgi:hypothetical protein
MTLKVSRPHAFARADLKSVPFFVVALVLSAALFYLAVSQALFQWKFRISVPYWDMISAIAFLDTHPSPSILDIYHFPDNEHRPVIAFLFYLWDRNRYGYDGEFLYRAIMVFNALLAISMLGIVAVRRKLSLVFKILFAAIVFLFFFSITNYENLTWQKQIHEILCLTLLSFGLLFAAAVASRADSDRSTLVSSALALLCGLCCLAATYSFGFGLAAWPAVLLHALLTRWRWAPLLIFFAITASAIVTYALSSQPHPGAIQAARQPLMLADYIVNAIGGILPFHGRPIATMITVPVVILSILLLLRFYLTFPARSAPLFSNVVAGHAAMLTVASLCITLMMALTRLTENQGLDSRYAVVGFLFWCALLILLLDALRGIAVPAVVLTFGFLALTVGTLPARSYENLLRAREQDMYRAGVMATYHLNYYPTYPALFYDATPFPVWDKPRPPFQSFAKREPFGWIGANLADLPAAPELSRCLGNVDAIARSVDVPRVVSLRGWAVITAPHSHLRWVVVTDASNRGLGVGKPGIARPDVRMALAAQGIDDNPMDQNYSGYLIAAVTEAGQRLLVWSIDDAGRACRLGGVVG